MRIRYHYRGNEKLFDQSVASVVIGRPRTGVHVDIDLTPDLRVSRPHARISSADGQYWIEDLNSVNWTYLNNQRLSPDKPAPLQEGDLLRLGNVLLTFRAG